mmetsp:Transcript_85722/g.154344  ORF Transcript_85722/g.154344 Transcript_85722/m.154344 type:complete len:87 (-) Transcript_85722:158-418(-)
MRGWGGALVEQELWLRPAVRQPALRAAAPAGARTRIEALLYIETGQRHHLLALLEVLLQDHKRATQVALGTCLLSASYHKRRTLRL